jgi:hypothetical protein
LFIVARPANSDQFRSTGKCPPEKKGGRYNDSTTPIRVEYVVTIGDLLLRLSGEGGTAWELRGGAQFFLDAQELVVLGDAVGA